MRSPNFIKISSDELSSVFKTESRQYLVGNLKLPQIIKHIQNENIEIGISAYKKNEIEEAHYHTDQIEFQYMVHGKTEYINLDTGEKFLFGAGDFYCIETGTKYAQRIYGKTKILFIKLPAINDKQLIEAESDIKAWLDEHLKNSLRRKDHFYNSVAPKPNSIVPAAAAVIIENDKLLMIRRVDNDKWSLPGGTLDYGESLEQCILREVKEETGLDIRIDGIVNIYSNPNILIEYANGEVRQEFTTVYRASKISGDLKIDSESKDIQWVSLHEVLNLNMAESQKIRINDIWNNHKIQNFQEIVHITSLENAIKIVNSEKYIPISNDPLNFDSCLNCFCTKIKGQNFGNTGAKIFFKWYGKVKKIDQDNTNVPYEKNILYNQEPWRCFIPTGSSKNLLQVVNIIPDQKSKDENLINTLEKIKNNDVYISVGK